MLHGAGVGVFGKPAPTPSSAVHLCGFAIFGETTVRNDSVSDSGVGGSLGGGSTIDDLWIQHTKVGMWFDGPADGLTVSGCRIQDTTADGVNLHDGVSHVTVQNTFVRNTGDDGMAMWSDQNADHDDAFVHDTVEQPQLANGFAVYGATTTPSATTSPPTPSRRAAACTSATASAPSRCRGRRPSPTTSCCAPATWSRTTRPRSGRCGSTPPTRR